MESRRKFTHVALALGIAALVASVVFTLLRLRYGADFIDEAFCVAQSYRFALGDRPFIDNADIHQLASWLVAPFAKLHLLIMGDTTGIMLGFRLAWALLNGLTAWATYALVRRMTSRPPALVAAGIQFTLMPYMIPTPSFNTIGLMAGSAAISILGCAMLDEAEKPWRYLSAGALLAIAVVAYQSLGIAAVAAVLGVWFVTKDWRRAAYTAAGGIGFALVVTALVSPYLSGLPAMLELASSVAGRFGWGGAGFGGPLVKLWLTLQPIALATVWQPAFWAAVATGVFQWMRKPVPFILPAAALALSAGALLDARDVSTLEWARLMLMQAAVIGFTVRDRDSITTVGRFALAYGLVAMLTFDITSSMSYIAAGLGGMAVIGPSVAVMVRALPRVPQLTAAGNETLRTAVVVVAMAGLLVANANAGYRDLPPNRLHNSVTQGPYKGLITTAANARGVESLWKALRKTTAEDRLLAYHGLPAAYLFTAAQPSVPLLWLGPYDALGAPQATKRLLGEMKSRDREPTVVVKNLAWPAPIVLKYDLNQSGYDPKKDAVERYVRDNFEEESSAAQWELLVPSQR